jgi:pyruvate dehydrogenase E2 component (dihydrolipoamide acetyltransferase)
VLGTERDAPRDYAFGAPVCTALSAQLTRPNTGTGIYNRCAPGAGGQRPGESRTYAVTVTRLSGPRGSLPHALRWVGNDGTFSSVGTVWLPLGEPRTVEVQATPAARRLARERGIDVKLLPGGKLLRVADIQPVLPGQAPAPVAPPDGATTRVDLSGRRRVIADRMLASLQSMAQLTASLEVDFTEALRLRAQLGELWSAEEKPSITDLVIRAAILALAEHPDLNATLEDNTLSLHQEVNVGLAVDAPGGLIVPVVHGAHAMSLRQLAAATTGLANKAREDALTLPELQGGTFTVTTLGQLGVDFFTPIVNPPQVAILGIGRVFDKLVMIEGEVAQRSAMYLNLSFDHRVIDGAPAARFLNSVKRLLELPVALVAT